MDNTDLDVEALQRAFEKAPYHQLQSLKVSLVGDGVKIRGAVRTWHMKQMAQEFARPRVNGHQIVNEVTVDSNGKPNDL